MSVLPSDPSKQNYGGVHNQGFVAALKDALTEENKWKDCLGDKLQVRSLSSKLEALSLKSVVVENQYIDHDFIDDYARYYSRCFRSYSRDCKRLHFFNRKFEDSDIEKIILDHEPDKLKELQDSYLGFVVIRPLPLTIIGKTCLQSEIPEDDSCRFALCDVKVSFFGCKLLVRCMPFQEQDKAVSACATSALWSACQVTASLFGHPALTPAAITSVATEAGTSLGRTMPNQRGLTVQEMAHAIRSVGLDIVCINLTDAKTAIRSNVILGNVFSYLSIGVPIIMVGALMNKKKTVRGIHAVCVNGYDLKCRNTFVNTLEAFDINALRVHDDQVGPYASFGRSMWVASDFTTPWKDPDHADEEVWFQVRYLLIPVYPKIRVNYEEIWTLANGFNQLARKVISKLPSLKVSIRWSIKLHKNTEFKQCIRLMTDIPRNERKHLLLMGLPKYIWKVSISANERENLVFGIDATDSGQGLSVLVAISRAGDVLSIVQAIQDHFPGVGMENVIYQACLLLSKSSFGVAEGKQIIVSEKPIAAEK